MLKANAWGLHDMHGNVWEWVQDCRYAPKLDRVNRGGSWDFNASCCRSATWDHTKLGHHHYDIGFRLLRKAP